MLQQHYALFEKSHRPGDHKLLSIAQQSYMWYETFNEKLNLDPQALAYSYVTRSGRIDHEVLRQEGPSFYG